MITTIGIIAALLTTFSGFPQLYKIIKTKETKDLSLITLIMLFVGILLWFIYGLYIDDQILIFCNLFAGLTQLLILIYKVIYK